MEKSSDQEENLTGIENPNEDVEMNSDKVPATNLEDEQDPFENFVVTPKKPLDKTKEFGTPQSKVVMEPSTPVKAMTPKSVESRQHGESNVAVSPSKLSALQNESTPKKDLGTLVSANSPTKDKHAVSNDGNKPPGKSFSSDIPKKPESPTKSNQVSPDRAKLAEDLPVSPKKGLNASKLFEAEALKYETQIAGLYGQISALTSKLEEQSAKNQAITKERDDKDVIIKEKLKIIEDLNAHKTRSVQETLDHEKQNLEFVLNAKQQECLHLSEELEYSKKQLQEKKLESRKDKELLAQTQASELELKTLLSNANQQVEQSQKIIDWLNQELAGKGEQLQQYRKEKSGQLSVIQAELEVSNQEKASLQIRNQNLVERNNELQEKLESKLTRIRELENNQITLESQFKIEMNSQKKLADLYQSKCQELTTQNEELEEVLRNVEGQLNRLSNESETRLLEKTEIIEEMQAEKNKLLLDIEKLESELQTINNELSAKSTSDQVGQLSQTAAVASRLQKTGKSFTQIFSEYTKLQQELIKEKSEVSRLNECLNHIVSEFEQKAPMIEKTNKDFQKAKQQNEYLAKSLSDVSRQNEEYSTQLKMLKAELEAKETEHQLYEKTLMDCGRQIQALLREQASLKGQLHDTSPIPIPMEETEADSIISNHLVIFKNIQELQTQNQKLLRSIRSLSAKLDQQESVTLKEAEESKIQALNESAALIEKLQDELRRQQLNSESYARERDQWRRIAETRKGSPNRSTNQSPEPGQENPPSVTNSADYESYYRELQREFDVYRKECGTDTKLLKTQLEQTQNEKMDLSIQVAKLNNQISYLNDRHEMLLNNLQSKEKEFEQLKERFSALNTMSTRQDLKIEELSNTLSSTRQTLDTTTFENQNLKLEKQVWKQSETRMSKDVQDLIKERNLANDRIREIQSLLEEKDHAHLQNAKKFEAQIEQLGRELQLSRKQLNDLLDDQRTLSSKRDAEMREYQLKVEKLTGNYERTKGELSVIQSKEAAATARLSELTIRLEQAENKARIYEEKILNTGELGPEATEIDQIRSLESELAKARIEVEKLKAELVLVTEQAETFKQISQASEERLDEMNTTFDVYKFEMEEKIAELTNKTTRLEQERTDLVEQLKKLGETLTSTQEAMDLEQSEHKNTLAVYDKQILSLKEREKSAIINVNEMKADVERQAKIAKDAQDNYEREIVAHSATIQSLSQMKQANLTLAQEKEVAVTECNVAKENLAQLTETFNSTKDKLQKEISELETRVMDLNNQNNLLHAQFEQLTSVRTSAAPTGEQTEGNNENLAELNEVIKYLRREKEIVDTKLQIARQEAERSRLQIEHLQKSLDENRLILEEERKRSQESLGSERKHLELMEKIEQSNLLRESNITLRSQLEASGKKVGSLEVKIKSLEDQISPLKEQIFQLEGEVEVRKAEISNLTEDNARWKGRAQQILEKYERIDPMEHQQLKNSVTTLTGKNEELAQELIKLRDELNAKISEKEQAVLKLTEEVASLVAERDRLAAENQKLLSDSKDKVGSEQLAEIQGKLDAAVARNRDLASQANEKLKAKAAQVKELKQTITALQQEKEGAEDRLNTALSEQKDSLTHIKDQEIQAIVKEWEAKAESLRKQLESPSSVSKKPEDESQIENATTPKRPRDSDFESEETSKRVKVDDEEQVADEQPPEKFNDEDQIDLEAEGEGENDEYEDVPDNEDEEEQVEEGNADIAMESADEAVEPEAEETSAQDISTQQEESNVEEPTPTLPKEEESKNVIPIPPIVPLGTSTPLFSQNKQQSAFGGSVNIAKPMESVFGTSLPKNEISVSNTSSVLAPQPEIVQTQSAPSSPTKTPSSPTKTTSSQIVVIQRTNTIPSATTTPTTVQPATNTATEKQAIPATVPHSAPLVVKAVSAPVTIKQPQASVTPAKPIVIVNPSTTPSATPTTTKAATPVTTTVSTPVSIKPLATTPAGTTPNPPVNVKPAESNSAKTTPVKQDSSALSAMEKKQKALLLQAKLKAEKEKRQNTTTPTSDQAAKPKVIRTVPLGAVRGKGSIKVRGARPGSGRGRGQPPT
ncbi:hypothetical protein HDV04_002241 [Boothiomyces sp. JEL0838]|nr:hypothetical protein HDV04_002241 [Boothiomyces sp. JEL0838]